MGGLAVKGGVMTTRGRRERLILQKVRAIPFGENATVPSGGGVSNWRRKLRMLGTSGTRFWVRRMHRDRTAFRDEAKRAGKKARMSQRDVTEVGAKEEAPE